jgi:hypothetical protein
MSIGSLPYADVKWGSGRSSEGSAASEEIVTGNFNDWMSEEEKQEAYGTKSSTKTQVKLDPLQVCLFPTYLSLPETVLQDDLRENLQVLVTAQLRKDYGDDFVYFAFTDAKIDWYSGEESKPVCGSLHHVLPSSANSDETILASKQRDAFLQSSQSQQESTPCTCALYSGATVVLKTNAVNNGDNSDNADADNINNNATPEILEPKIAAVLTDDLVTTLRNWHEVSQEDGVGIQQRPFYTELKGASVSWSAAQRQQGGKLVYVKDYESANNQHLNAQQPPALSEPATAVLDESVEDSTFIDVVNFNVDALNDGSDVAGAANANAFATTRGTILASVVGALLLASLVVLFCVLRLKKKQRKQISLRSGEKANAYGNNAHDTSTVISSDEVDVDEEIARGGILRMNRMKRMNNNKKKNKKWGAAKESAASDDDDESEAAQYKNTSGILDCISVGSEWTLATGVTPYSHSGNNSKTMAEMLAAKETFDRDRQITLQKDMLQSEWSAGAVGVGALSPPSGVALTRASGNRSKLNSSNTKNNNNNTVVVATATTTNNTNGANALQFEEATGQGEEIFLMQPAR